MKSFKKSKIAYGSLEYIFLLSFVLLIAIGIVSNSKTKFNVGIFESVANKIQNIFIREPSFNGEVVNSIYFDSNGHFYSYSKSSLESDEIEKEKIHLWIKSKIDNHDMLLKRDNNHLVNYDITIKSISQLRKNYSNPKIIVIIEDSESSLKREIILSALNLDAPDIKNEIPVGNGDLSNPYQIWYIEHLEYIRTDTSTMNAHYELMRSLDFNENDSYIYPHINKDKWAKNEVNADKKGWTPIGNNENEFKGVFDGNYKSINRLYINEPSINYVGFFGSVSGSEIKNLEIKNSEIKGQRFVGIVSGKIKSSNLIDVKTNGDVIASEIYSGGFAGNVEDSLIENSSFIGTVNSSNSRTGGFVGYLENSTINKSSSKGKVMSTSETPSFNGIGGFAGVATTNSIIKNSKSEGEVSGLSSVGGFVGQVQSSQIINSLSLGDVSASGVYSGGFAGLLISSSVIEDSHFIGIVNSSSDLVGGFAGIITDSIIKNSKSEVEVSGISKIGGFVGQSQSSSQIINSSSLGEVSASGLHSGGFVGFLISSSVIEDSHFIGIVNSSSDLVGGFAGMVTGSIIKNSKSEVKVSGISRVGGFVGQSQNSSQIINSSSLGEVSASGLHSGGFIGFFSSLSVVEDSHFIGIVNSSSDLVGGFAGMVTDSIIKNSKSEVKVSGISRVGGFTGQAQNSSQIINSSSLGEVSASGLHSGGFIGFFSSSSVIEDSHFIGIVNSLNSRTGGFVGHFENAIIRRSSSKGDVISTGETSSSTGVGGFAGRVTLTSFIEDSSSQGNVFGLSSVGGFAGQVASSSRINNSNSEGSVEATLINSQAAGGFVGSLSGSSIISESTAKGRVSGFDRVGGFVGTIFSNSHIVNSTSDMSEIKGSTNSGGYIGRISGNSSAISNINPSAKGVLTKNSGVLTNFTDAQKVFGNKDSTILPEHLNILSEVVIQN